MRHRDSENSWLRLSDHGSCAPSGHFYEGLHRTSAGPNSGLGRHRAVRVCDDQLGPVTHVHGCVREPLNRQRQIDSGNDKFRRCTLNCADGSHLPVQRVTAGDEHLRIWLSFRDISRSRPTRGKNPIYRQLNPHARKLLRALLPSL